MAMTAERKGKLVAFLNADQARAQKLVALDPSEALGLINAHGYDFTVGEIKEFAQSIQDDVLSGVSGGTGHGDVDEDGIPLLPLVPLIPLIPLIRPW